MMGQWIAPFYRAAKLETSSHEQPVTLGWFSCTMKPSAAALAADNNLICKNQKFNQLIRKICACRYGKILYGA
jgi:hypothetical protein